MNTYKALKKQELRSQYDTFDLANTLREQVNNDYWRQKKAVWTIISAACNEAASDFYIKIREYVKNLVDIDVCNIHALKSIAKSVNAEHLTDFIKQDYPIQLQNLINLFSIKSSKLLEFNQQLHPIVLYPLYGNLDLRNCLIRPDTISKSLILDIYENIDKIQKLLEYNNCSFDMTFKDLVNTNKSYDQMAKIWYETKLQYSNLLDNSLIYFYDINENKINTFTYDYNEFIKLTYLDYEINLGDTYTNIIPINRQIKLQNEKLYIKLDDIWTLMDQSWKSTISSEINEIGSDNVNINGSISSYTYEVTVKENYDSINYSSSIEYIRSTSIDLANHYIKHCQDKDIDSYINIKTIIENIKNIGKQFKQIQKNKIDNSSLNSLLNLSFNQEEQENVKTYIENIFCKAAFVVQDNNKFIFNPFFAIIEVIKSCLFTHVQNTFLPFYYEKDTNIRIEMDNLCNDIVQTINKHDAIYIKHYMYYHLYHLFKQMISNDQIKNDFEINNENNQYDINYVSKLSEYTKDDFVSQISAFLGNEDIKQLLGDSTYNQEEQISTDEFNVQITHYKKPYIDFALYLFLINSVSSTEQNSKIFPYKLYLYNNDFDIKQTLNQYYRQLYGLDENGDYTQFDYIDNVVRQYVDICLKISYVRQDIKALIQQYTFIGTERIITDVIRDYYLKNFSKRSSWRYISDLFKNRDDIQNSPLKTIEELNGNNLYDKGDTSFQPSIIEYYDQTSYLNIQTDLPSCIAYYKTVTGYVESSYIITQDLVSTIVLTADTISTILDTFDYEVPYAAVSSQVAPSEQEFILPAVTMDPTNNDFLSKSSLSTIYNVKTGGEWGAISGVVNQMFNTIEEYRTNELYSALDQINSQISTDIQTIKDNYITETEEIVSADIIQQLQNDGQLIQSYVESLTNYRQIEATNAASNVITVNDVQNIIDVNTYIDILHTQYTNISNQITSISTVYNDTIQSISTYNIGINPQTHAELKNVVTGYIDILTNKYNIVSSCLSTLQIDNNNLPNILQTKQNLVSQYTEKIYDDVTNLNYAFTDTVASLTDYQATLHTIPQATVLIPYNTTLINETNQSVNNFKDYCTALTDIPDQINTTVNNSTDILKAKVQSYCDTLSNITSYINEQEQALLTTEKETLIDYVDLLEQEYNKLVPAISSYIQDLDDIIDNTEDLLRDYEVPNNEIILSPQIRVSANILPSTGILTSIIIPAGTEVSSTIPANTWITTSFISSFQQPVYALCADFVYDYNERFWERDITNLTYSDLQNEITFYEKYFDNLSRVKSKKLKLKVYKEQIYPLLTEIWNQNATSGFLHDNLSALHYQYSGSDYAKYPTINNGNKTFTTIAPLPFIPNLIQINNYDSDESLLAKPIYDNIAYYINMLMQDVYNMYNINNSGFGITKDGWKQTNVEFKGYVSKYEKSKNIIDIDNSQNVRIDVDGPWVYAALREFIKLYYTSQNNYITISNINNYIQNYTFNLTSLQKSRLATQLLNYQDKIINLQKYKLYNYQTDIYENQFVLFKYKDHCQFEDIGQIWIRMKNYPLSVPAMNNCIDININGYNAKYLALDTLQFNDDTRYSNMFKQLCNNALQFGIHQNKIWILGYTNYITNANERLVKNNTKVLKLVCAAFTLNDTYNSLVINSLSVKSFSINQNNDKLNTINEFIGVNTNSDNNTIDFTLYKDTNVSSKSNFIANDLNLNTIVYSYDKETYDVDYNNIVFQHTIYPLVDVYKLSTVIDNVFFETFQLSANTILGQTFYNTIRIDDFGSDTLYCIGTLYDIGGSYHLIGTINKVIYDNLTDIYSNGFKYLGTFEATTSLSKFDANQGYFKDSFNDTKVSNFIFKITVQKNIQNSTYEMLDQLWKNTYNFENNNQSYIEETPYNIWRLSETNGDVSIAYESINTNILDYNGIISALNIERNIDAKYIGYIQYDCELITKQILDANDGIIYMNQIKNISASIDTIQLNKTDINDEDLLLIQQDYPSCTLTKDNHMIINTIGTTLGNKKNLWVRSNDIDFSDKENGPALIRGLIKDSASGAIDALLNTIELSTINYLIKTDPKQDEYEETFLSSGLTDVQFITEDGSITGYFNFYDHYQKYLEDKAANEPVSSLTQTLLQYNKVMENLSKLTTFNSVVTDFLVQPMKLIYNFGDFDNENYILRDSDFFDMDVNTYIDTTAEKNNKVGYKCGHRTTEYLQWVSDDQSYGGPELVYVDLQKYKIDNNDTKEVDIIINPCWFVNTNIQTLNPNIIINWKGFTYQYIIQDMQISDTCCNFPFLKVNVNLQNNAVYCYRVMYIPYIMYYKNNDKQLYIGFIYLYENDLNNIFNDSDIVQEYTIQEEGLIIQFINDPHYNYTNDFVTIYDDKDILNKCGIIYNKTINELNPIQYKFEKNIKINNNKVLLYNERILNLADDSIIYDLPPDLGDYFTITAEADTCIIKVTKTNDNLYILNYRLDDHSLIWDSWLFNDEFSITLQKGQFIQFKQIKYNTFSTQDNIIKFNITGAASCSGNINSLINSNTELSDYTFNSLFENCDIINLPTLNFTELGAHCYENMFKGCKLLTNIPSEFLSSVELKDYCYNGMFKGCIGLLNIPFDLLPATIMKNYCYASMFEGCTGLTYIPKNFLQARILANYCYKYMFKDCINIQNIIQEEEKNE